MKTRSRTIRRRVAGQRVAPRVPLRTVALAVAIAVASLALPPFARAQDADPWFGRDKALHFTATASIALVGYGGAALVTDDRPVRAAAAAGLALGAGIAKELWDLGGPGDASWKDLTWDVVGTATGVLVASAVDWMIRRMRQRAPATNGR